VERRFRIQPPTPSVYRYGDYAPLNPSRPIRTLKEVGEMLNLHPDRVKYLENLAFAKLRAALSAYGYNEDTP
jgi:DNA-directed RNA polymerase sigma subunit (sigma70/sigma32)